MQTAAQKKWTNVLSARRKKCAGEITEAQYNAIFEDWAQSKIAAEAKKTQLKIADTKKAMKEKACKTPEKRKSSSLSRKRPTAKPKSKRKARV